MSNLRALARYVPVTSFAKAPVDRSPVASVAIVGTSWGKGSGFEFSATLRFPTETSGLSITEGVNDGTLPRRRVILEAECEVKNTILNAAPFEFPVGTLVQNDLLLPVSFGWKVSTELPKQYIGQAEPAIRTYDYFFDKANVFSAKP